MRIYGYWGVVAFISDIGLIKNFGIILKMIKEEIEKIIKNMLKKIIKESVYT